MPETVHTVGFTITGEFVTGHARDLCLYENDWEGGYRFLMQSIEGIDHNMAVDILRGEKRLIGESGYGKENTLDLADEDPEVQAEIKEQMDYRWGGIIRMRPDYWRPYACVTSWGSHDVGAASRYGNPRYETETAAPVGSARLKKWSESRCCEYMNDPAQDRVEYLKMPERHSRAGETLAVLFEKVTPPPIWLTPIPPHHGCWEESVAAYDKECRLEERGHKQKFDDMPTKFSSEEIAEESEKRLSRTLPESDYEDTLKDQLLQQVEELGIDTEAAAGTIERILGSGADDETPPVPDDPKDHNYGWITKDGEFYGCMYHHHMILAERIWKFIEKTTDEDKLANPEVAGEDANWVKITKSAIDSKYKVFCKAAHPNERQMKMLNDWAAWHKQDAEELLKWA